MKNIVMWCLPGLLAVSSAVCAQAQRTSETATSAVQPIATAKDGIEALGRGERLAKFGGCNDCHTPKLMTPKGPELDKSRLLSGYPAHAPLPAVPQGVVDPTQWGAVTTNDLTALFAYLQSLKPISNSVPQPIPPDPSAH